MPSLEQESRQGFVKDSLAHKLEQAEDWGYLWIGTWGESLDVIMQFARTCFEITGKESLEDWPQAYIVLAFVALVNNWLNRDCDSEWPDDTDETIARIFVKWLEDWSPDITGDVP